MIVIMFYKIEMDSQVYITVKNTIKLLNFIWSVVKTDASFAQK